MVRRVEERSQVAEILRRARQRLELSIEHAAADAGVPLRYARILEGEVPAGVGISDELYLVPFLRRYARALGLNAEELLPEFLGQVHEVPPAASHAVRARPNRTPALWKGAAVVLAIAVATVVILRQTPDRSADDEDVWSDGEPAASDAVELAAAPQPTLTAAAESPIAAITPAFETAAAASAPIPTATVAAAGAIGGRELRIVAAEETWLSLGIDDEPKRNILLQPGETRSWTAARGFTLTVGNAGGITVSLDGHELPPLGRSGQVVRNLRLPPGDAPAASGG
jgi:cytoskeletal protein RodZ